MNESKQKEARVRTFKNKKAKYLLEKLNRLFTKTGTTY